MKIDTGRFVDRGIEKLLLQFAEHGGSVPVFSDSYMIFPGLCDVHVHLREPGYFYKESIASGTRSSGSHTLGTRATQVQPRGRA